MYSSDSDSVLPAKRHAVPEDDRCDASQLRIVFLSDALEERNGVGTYYRDLVQHLQDHLQAVYLFCPGNIATARYEYCSLPMPGDRTQSLRLPSARRLSRAIREADPHVIVAGTPGPYGFLGCLMAKRMNIPLCSGHHTRFDKLVELYWDGFLGRMAGSCLAWINGILFKASSIVAVNSEIMEQQAREVGAKEVWMMGTPIGKRFLSTTAAPASASIGSVLFAGRLAPEKNVEAVLEAAERLSDVRFTIAGDGPQAALVKQKTEELPNLEYLGWISREEVVSLMDRNDMLVLPSKVESFGTIALEAMARRKLVLVSPHCGILDWESLTGGIFAMSAEETLADAIGRIRNLDRQARIEKAEAAYRAVESLNANTIERWLEIFVLLARQGRKRRAAGKRKKSGVAAH